MPRYRRRRRGEPFTIPVNQPKGPPPGPEILPWYWHPDREGVQPPPAAFAERLAEIDPDLRVCFSPVHERFLIWVKSPRSKNSLCTGWLLLFIWEDPITKEFMPLTELVFHNIFYIARDKFPRAEAYFERIQADIAKAKAAREAAYQNDRKAEQRERFSGFQISTAGKGNKAALHHSGTVVPSPGEQAWRAETRKARMPGAQIQAEQDDREKQFYGR